MCLYETDQNYTFNLHHEARQQCYNESKFLSSMGKGNSVVMQRIFDTRDFDEN